MIRLARTIFQFASLNKSFKDIAWEKWGSQPLLTLPSSNWFKASLLQAGRNV